MRTAGGGPSRIPESGTGVVGRPWARCRILQELMRSVQWIWAGRIGGRSGARGSPAAAVSVHRRTIAACSTGPADREAPVRSCRPAFGPCRGRSGVSWPGGRAALVARRPLVVEVEAGAPKWPELRFQSVTALARMAAGPGGIEGFAGRGRPVLGAACAAVRGGDARGSVKAAQRDGGGGGHAVRRVGAGDGKRSGAVAGGGAAREQGLRGRAPWNGDGASGAGRGGSASAGVWRGGVGAADRPPTLAPGAGIAGGGRRPGAG